MSRKKENYAYGSLKERLVIITVRQSRLSSKVRAIVPVPQSHFANSGSSDHVFR